MPLAIAQKTDEELVAEIFDMLDRWDARLNGHQNQKREHSRVPFRSQIVVELPELADFENVSEEDAQLRVWARNISPAGVGFLYRGTIHSRKVIVCLDPNCNAQHRYVAKIVRSRKLQDDFREYGAVLLERVAQ